MRVAVIGTGYVGLVAGTCLADSGNDVVCVDIDKEKVARLTRGEVPIYEPGLAELVQKNVAGHRLSFTTDLTTAAKAAEVIFIAVGTPSSHDGGADLTAVLSVAEAIAPCITGYKVVVLKSTVPVGTNAKVAAVLAAKAKGPFDVASNPEFMKEGAALDDFLKPDRVVVGVVSERARAVMQDLYEPFLRTGKPMLFMDPASAEMTKYAANAMLATKISFMNEVAALCEATGADVEQVRKGIGSDARIGFQFIFPGLGFGGSCFPKDVRALTRLGDDLKVPMRISAAVDAVNQDSRARFTGRLIERLAPHAGKRVAVWGLAFKPKTDDVREAPSLTIIPALLEKGVSVSAFDPVAEGTARKALGEKVRFTGDAYEAAEGADALVVVTEWNEFRHPDFERLKKLLRQPVIFDGRNIYDPARMAQAGFEYHAIGRPSVTPR
ncbi:MAG TPA: UDP-glucose/GDP-mannose dehydrogenase family protein [bacterium]|nr:UDP-glucose/GDP-mannose dehydrogenase family protein [bacterium]